MGPSGMAGQGYYNSGMGGFQGGFNMGPTSPPSPFALSMYGSYPQGYGHPFKAMVNLATDLGLLILSIPHRRTPLPRSCLVDNLTLHHNIQPTLNILSSLNNLFTSNLSSNLDLSRTTTNNLATIRLHKPLSTSTL